MLSTVIVWIACKMHAYPLYFILWLHNCLHSLFCFVYNIRNTTTSAKNKMLLWSVLWSQNFFWSDPAPVHLKSLRFRPLGKTWSLFILKSLVRSAKVWVRKAGSGSSQKSPAPACSATLALTYSYRDGLTYRNDAFYWFNNCEALCGIWGYLLCRYSELREKD